MTVSQTPFQVSDEAAIDHVQARCEHADKFAVISYLLDKANEAQSEDQRSRITEELFKFINKNSQILKSERGFRMAVQDKIHDLEAHIRQRQLIYSKAKYDEALSLVRKSFTGHIRHKEIRRQLLGKLEEINGLLNVYQSWNRADSLLDTFSKTKTLLINIEMGL
jgi:hypothetical protein